MYTGGYRASKYIALLLYEIFIHFFFHSRISAVALLIICRMCLSACLCGACNTCDYRAITARHEYTSPTHTLFQRNRRVENVRNSLIRVNMDVGSNGPCTGRTHESENILYHIF